MSAVTTADRAGRRHGWVQAVAAVLAALVAMLGVAALGLWAAGAARLPDGAFARVVVATVVTAVGGSVELSGNAGVFAETRAGLTVVPLSVTLVGVFMVGGAFLRPLRRRAPAGGGELAGWAARIAVLWLLGLAGLALAARQTFAVDVGSGVLGGLTGLFDSAPTLGFAADVPRTVLFGLLWLAGVLVLALLVSPGVPLPRRLTLFQESARPAVLAVVALLLGYVVLGVVSALVTAATRGHVADTFAVLLLGLPNLAWPALTVGLGASWHGRVDGPFGLPVPHVLDEVLRTPDVSTLNLSTLAGHDGRAWWLLVAAVVLVPAAALLMVARSPAGVRAWRHALCFAGALVVAVLVICLVGRISAHYGLSLLGIGDLGGGLSGELLLRPDVWPAVGLAALWGLVTGFLGGLLARPLHRRGGAGPERRTRGR
ncbi:streptophobe family protein [Streptomyces sp. NPDC056161]|uniref:streptophobe family protein n=1 Tax=Streptomyces sp. NPDC056161 TaxID=3345732 RepID=UPI0035D9158D